MNADKSVCGGAPGCKHPSRIISLVTNGKSNPPGRSQAVSQPQTICAYRWSKSSFPPRPPGNTEPQVNADARRSARAVQNVAPRNRAQRHRNPFVEKLSGVVI